MTRHILQAAPIDRTRRVSSDSAWPIKLACGRTPAQIRPDYQRKETNRAQVQGLQVV